MESLFLTYENIKTTKKKTTLRLILNLTDYIHFKRRHQSISFCSLNIYEINRNIKNNTVVTNLVFHYQHRMNNLNVN